MMAQGWHRRARTAIAAAAAAVASLGLADAVLAQGNVTSVPPVSLSAAEVGQIISQAVQEAQARGRPATIAVTDRVGNVLGVFRMNGAPIGLVVTTNRGIPAGNGLELVDQALLAALNTNPVTTELSAIAKAVTGAYLSSSGNAFSTRSASQIIQENFNPLEYRAPGGPLYGVQFSSLPCSDLSLRETNDMAGNRPGPKRSPLGLSGDPGGLPLYKNGFVVGGIGAESDGIYTIDRIITDIDTSDDELIAVAGAAGFDAPTDIRAQRITVGGKSLRYIDRDRTDRNNPLASNPANAPAFAAIDGVLGNRLAVRGYFSGGAPPALRDGTAYGTAASGYAPDPTGALSTFGPALVLRDPANVANNRFPPANGTGPGALALTANEVATIVVNGLKVGFAGRAQIRRPLNSFIQVTVVVVDVNGVILGVARTPDGPIFGTDVAVQKARSAMFFSRDSNSPGGSAATLLAAYNSPVAALPAFNQPAGNNALGVNIPFYVNQFRAVVQPTSLNDGTAYSARGIGNLHRPFFPDGVDGEPHGPLSTPYAVWSPFNVGLQLDLVIDNIAQHLLFVNGTLGADTPAQCSFLPATSAGLARQLANGLQIFAGGFPIYRNGVLIGGIGISGDGIDQDDMIGFLGLHNGAVALGTGVGNAAFAIRNDQLSPRGARLRYVNCPFQPNAGGHEQNVCRGK